MVAALAIGLSSLIIIFSAIFIAPASFAATYLWSFTLMVAALAIGPSSSIFVPLHALFIFDLFLGHLHRLF